MLPEPSSFATSVAAATRTCPADMRLAPVAILLLAAAITGGCGAPFNIKTRTSVPASYSSFGGNSSIMFSVEALRDEDVLYDTFDANLILAGLLAVRVKVTNSGSEPVDLKETRFGIKSKEGRAFKSIDARAALKRLLTYYQISTYSKAGYKRSRDDLASHQLDNLAPLGPGESREGLVFFRLPDELIQQPDLTFIVSKLDRTASDVQLKLN
jgi:hypothetical protein